jgi:hypothetical protein
VSDYLLNVACAIDAGTIMQESFAPGPVVYEKTYAVEVDEFERYVLYKKAPDVVNALRSVARDVEAGAVVGFKVVWLGGSHPVEVLTKPLQARAGESVA